MASRETRKPRQSGRVRQWSARMKALSKIARQEALQRRIGILESDSYWEDTSNTRNTPGDDDYVNMSDEDGEFGEPTPKRRKPANIRATSSSGAKAKRFKAPPLKNFQAALELEGYDRYPQFIPTYLTIEVKPSIFPPRHYCYVCGNVAPYQCPDCGLRFCRIRCNIEHKESRCLKYIA